MFLFITDESIYNDCENCYRQPYALFDYRLFTNWKENMQKFLYLFPSKCLIVQIHSRWKKIYSQSMPKNSIEWIYLFFVFFLIVNIKKLPPHLHGWNKQTNKQKIEQSDDDVVSKKWWYNGDIPYDLYALYRNAQKCINMYE